MGGWVGPRAVLDALVKRKIPSPRQESNPRTPIVQPVVILNTAQTKCLSFRPWLCEDTSSTTMVISSEGKDSVPWIQLVKGCGYDELRIGKELKEKTVAYLNVDL
jgi:hypothetical protein